MNRNTDIAPRGKGPTSQYIPFQGVEHIERPISKPLPESLLAPIYRAYLDAVKAGDKNPTQGAVIWTRLCVNLLKGKESIGYHGNGFAWWGYMLTNAGFGAKKYDCGPLVCEMGYRQLAERMGEPLPLPE